MSSVSRPRRAEAKLPRLLHQGFQLWIATRSGGRRQWTMSSQLHANWHGAPPREDYVMRARLDTRHHKPSGVSHSMLVQRAWCQSEGAACLHRPLALALALVGPCGSSVPGAAACSMAAALAPREIEVLRVPEACT